jgi:hypothetical protein
MSDVVIRALREGILKREAAIRELQEDLFRIEASQDCIEMWEFMRGAETQGKREG